MFDVNHDQTNDVLYIGIGDRSNSYGDEEEAGIIILRDIDTEELTGITILDFLHRYKNRQLTELPLPINFERDIIPQII